MHIRRIVSLAIVVTATGACAKASTPGVDHAAMNDEMHTDAMHAEMHRTSTDSAFPALQERGKIAMGVDQYTSTHVFDDRADGGRIELQRNTDDPEGVRTIREHLQNIANAFSSGDFSTPAFVHMQNVPGTKVMAERRNRITYTFKELPRGGEVRITTTDTSALNAIHAFLAFQRSDHRAAGNAHKH